MLELLVVGALVLAALFVVGLVGSILGLVFWVITLPFQLLGLAFRGLACLIFLPFLAVIGVIGLLVFGVGFFAALMPVMPFLLLIAGAIWLFRRRPPVTAAERR